ncbi:MAG: flap endonuclease-1 [Candidatus Micrarchaeota archaeon]|nr:flap endonuclease-1 [Candidatus Micrarchaeota archaeon]
MGVDLGELPKISVALSDLAGKRFAVDAYNTIYQFLSSVRQPDGTPLMDSQGNITGHLAGIFYRNAKLLENGIRPIYVFDGKPPGEKEEVLKERSERKREAEAAWKAALEKGNLEEARKAAQATSRLTPEMAKESKQLLELMGIPVVEAPSEGEAQAAQMVIEGAADAVASQDADCLLFGAPLLLRNLSVGGRRKLPGKNEYVSVEPEFVELRAVLEALGIDRRRLIWMGILVGTDFDEGVKGIGPKKALKIVKEAHSLDDAVLKAGAGGQLELFRAVEHFFLEPPVKKGVAVQFGKMKTEEIVEFLCKGHDFSEERVRRTCENVEKQLKEVGAQTKLSSWQ